MDPAPLAISIHQFVSSAGADAGFASLLGLAILVLMHFAQARETATLREQAYQAAQRVQQLEARISQLSRAQAPTPTPPPAKPSRAAIGGAPVMPSRAATAQAPPGQSPQTGPAPMPAPVAAPAAMTAAAVSRAAPAAPAVPSAPAGVAAPALTAATRLIPAVAAPSAAGSLEGGRSHEGGPQEATAVTPPPPATVASGARSPAALAADAPASVAVAPERPPVAGNGPALAGGGPPRGSNGASQAQAPTRAGSGPVRASGEGQSRAGAAAAPQRPLLASSGPAPKRSRTRIVVPLIILLAAAGVVAALLVLTSTSGGGKPARISASAGTAAHGAQAGGVNPASVTVAVLNGTDSSGLAHRVATRLQSGGYHQGIVATAADQTRTATVVSYSTGHRTDALSVAGSLKLGSASVQPIDPSTQAIACPPPSACTATVVVTVGTDLASG